MSDKIIKLKTERYTVTGYGAYYRYANCIVTVIINTVNGVSDGGTLFTLPEGFRPSDVLSFKGEGASASATANFRIDNNGNVKVWGGSSGSQGSFTFVIA